MWPSTGNYCRGGVAISRLMGCRGVAVLPEGMSRERFDWLDRWVVDPGDIVRTPGTESNVKEIYDACKELAADPDNVILNQFSEFGNHLVHYLVHRARRWSGCSSRCASGTPGLRLRAFVSATGSAGTIAAGDYLKERFGSLIVAVEALECPTLLCNGFGEHNIQGIGDKHIPLIHNVMNTDVALAVSDRATDRLGVLFGTDAGRRLPGRPRRGRQRSSTALAVARALEHLQRARRDQDREVLRARAGRRDRHRRHRRRRDVRQRARDGDRAGTSPAGSTSVDAGGGLRRAPARRRHRPLPRARDARTASGSSTSATSPGSSSRASRSRTSRRAATRRSGAALREVVPVWDDDDRRVQRPDGRAGGA